MMLNEIITLDQVLPHRDTMRWLDRLLSHDENTVVVEALIRESHVLAVDEGVPAWAGVEYMAQAIAAWAGCRALDRDEPIKIGFLLGTRKYECKHEYFHFGQRLIIRAHCELFGENGLGMFSCRILNGKDEIATANLSVYEPPNATEFLTSNLT
jgi:predicted hotdog family 3-hydroxylacyl-ACP dehydratase